MFKNLLKKNMIVIFGIALLCSALVTYSFIRSSSNTSSFEQSGYIHVDVNESEDKRVLFSGGQKYKNIVDSKIKFNDSASKERRIGSDNFIHYDDDSIAAFKDGVIVNIGELSSETSTMNHFYISPGMALRNTGSSYTAENSGQEIDFSDFLWKISENKYLAISKSISANFSETDQRDCGTYAEITYLDGKVIQIQTDDNVWQTISDEAKLILNDGSIVDLAMKNIKDQNGNVLLDFSRIIIDPNSNIELTPFDAEMESINENVIPRFVVNNTPGDSGADGTSGIIGLTGVDGLDGNKGKQGEDGLSDDKRGDDEGKQFPIFSVMNWKVTPNSCYGKIYVEDESEVLINNDNAGSGLASTVYLVDLDTGDNIPLPEANRPSPYQFADIRNNSESYFEFTFTGLQADHSYMLYASAPIQMSDESNPYSRGFVSKTFWTDSTGVYIEDAAVDTNSYQVVAHTNNINSAIGVYLFKYPFESYDVISTLNLSTIKDKYANADLITSEPLWPVGDEKAEIIPGSKTMDPYTSYLGVDATGSPVIHTDAIKSNTHYYTMLLFDLNGDKVIDDYSVQILDTLTLKMRPTVAAPSLETNKTIGGFDITPGIIVDEDAAVTNYAIEIYKLDHIDTQKGEANKFTVKIDPLTKKPYEPDKIINLKNNSPASVSMGGLATDNYISREVLTVFDNEKEYYVYSGFSNSSHLEESVQPMVYFEPFGQLDSEGAKLSAESPYYDTCVGILHVYPGSNGYMYLVNEGSTIQIDGDNYSYSFLLDPVDKIKGDRSIYDGAKFPAITKGNGEVEIYFLDYVNGNKSWMSGLKANSEYYVTVYGDLYTDLSADLTNPENIVKHMTTVGKCTIKTPKPVGMHLSMSVNPSSPNILKNLSMGVATPSQLRKSLNKPLADDKEESNYNRQIETFYGFKVTAYLNDYSEEMKYLPSTDEKIVDGKTYYSQGVGNVYTKVKPEDYKDIKPCDAWYEYKEVPFKPEDYWFTKTFTNDALWKTGNGEESWQVYMLYDFESKNEQLKTGVQVVGVPNDKGYEDYVLSSNGTISLLKDDWKYPYLNYNTDTGLPTSTEESNRITSQDVNGGGLRFKVTPLNKLDSLFSATIERGRSTATADVDYVVSSGGMLFDDSIFDDVLGETLEKAVLGEEGVIKKKGAIGVTLIVEEIFDYTGNPDDSSLNKQQQVKVPSKDEYVELIEDGSRLTKTYFTKNGDLYTAIDIFKLNPSQLGLFVKDTSDGTTKYVKATETEMVYNVDYYYLYRDTYHNQDVYYRFDISDDFSHLIPAQLGWYENSNHYVNYFENIGEKRIYIPFSRSIGDINLELPYNTDPKETEGKIERHTVSDDDEYHYYYTAQANFLNSNLLADTITYRIYDSVDFYNTKNHLNNDKEYVNWALLGRDPRITNPSDLFTDTWLIQDVQTCDESPNGEYVYQQVIGIDSSSDSGFKKIKPYTYGWFELSGDKYVLTKDTSVVSGTDYYINSGENTYELLDTSSFSPKNLKWYEEEIVPVDSADNAIDKNKTYYVKTLEQSLDGNRIEYNVVDPENISPSSFCWYELNSVSGLYSLSNDTAISPTDKDYYYFDGTSYHKIDKSWATAGNIKPASLGWYYGNRKLTNKDIINDGDRFFVKYLINVHSTDETSSGAYTNYDTYVSPVENHYKEKAKIVATDTTVVSGTRYYTQYFNEKNLACYKLIDINSNEYKMVTNPSTAGWFMDDEDMSHAVFSNDKYFDVEKEYFDSSNTSVNASISPKAQGWFEKSKELSTDTLINYSKSYFARKTDGTYTSRINPNINPYQLNWYETAKKNAENPYNDGTKYYAKVGDRYVLVGSPINPNVIGWYEAKKVVTEDPILSPDTTYFVRILDADWKETFEVFDRNNIKPSDLKWREKDEVKKEKFISTDSSVVDGKKYYIPVGQNNFVEYVGGATIKPNEFGLFVEERLLSSDTEANSNKTYYSSLEDDAEPINISSLDLSKLDWYVDDTSVSRILSQDQSFDTNKSYYAYNSETSTYSLISSGVPFSPNALQWYEDEWVLSEDTQIDSNKEYAIRYLTNPKGSSAVTTEGLELAKITLSFNNSPNKTPTIFFFPCTYEYAKLHYAKVLESATNCVFFDDDSFEELYGHQFIITWTVNYHHYMSEEMNGAWHLVFPFDASAKIGTVSLNEEGKPTQGATYDTTFSAMAETYENEKFSGFVLGLATNPTEKLPNGDKTVFGKNAYMAVPHNYIELDEPKQAPTVYALQWDSGSEVSSSGISNKFVTTRTLVTDAYNATFNHKVNSSDSTNHAFTSAYVVPNKVAETNPELIEEIRINNTPGDTVSSETKAIENIISVDPSTMITTDSDKYAIGEVKISEKAVSHDSVNGFVNEKGLGYAPVVLPIQLYSNKYVTQKESLHIVPENTYVKGSTEVGSDENWTFVKNADGKTLNKDKFAPLFTAFFNDEVDINSLSEESLIKLKPHIENQELKGYDVELIAPPEVIKDAIGVRLRFEIHDYREATSSDYEGSPAYGGDQSLGLYEAQMIKKDATETVVEEGKTYYWQVGYKYYEYKIDNTGSSDNTIVTPNLYGWYVEGEGDKAGTYVATSDVRPIDGTTYYYLKKNTKDEYIKIDDPYKLNPAQVGLLDETYEDVKWTEDLSVADKKYLYQTDDVLYSMNIDKYLPMAETDKPSYSKEEGNKRLEIIKNFEGKPELHMYFAIAAEELDFDDEYRIDTALNRSFNGKDGIRVYASYIYETDRGGYSYLENSSSGNLSYSKRADSIINNKTPGTFSIRKHTLSNTNNNYYLDADPSTRSYFAFVAQKSGASASIISEPKNVYQVNVTEDVKNVVGDYTLNRFGSFFSVAEYVAADTSSQDLTIKTTRYQKLDNEIKEEFAFSAAIKDSAEVIVPSIITADSKPAIKVVSWKSNRYFNEDKPATYGIMQFPKSNLYIAFNNGTSDDGTEVTRQQARLKYQIYNADSSHKIYALVTKTPVDVNADRASLPSATYDVFAFNETVASPASQTLISTFKSDSENTVIQSKINLADIYRTYVNCSSPTDYFSKMDNEHKVDGAKYADLFIPIKDGTVNLLDSVTLEALPYNSSYSVSFWVWSLIGESDLGSEYGWVSVPYSSLRTNSETIEFETHDIPSASLEKCKVIYGIGENHTDGYSNKSFETNIHNGANDLYYVVDLIDNETNELICHLFTAERENSDVHKFDLDGISGGDGTSPIYKTTSTNRKLITKGSSLAISTNDSTDSLYNSFRYGKLADGKDRYKLVLHTYIMGNGPATLVNPENYDFTKDEDSAYLVYRYIKDENGKTKKDTNPNHILKKNISNTELGFSLNDGFDKVEHDETIGYIGIDIKNYSNVKRSNVKPDGGPRIEFKIEKPIYNSYSLAYEKYIPVIIRTRLSDGNVESYEDITKKVFSDKVYGEENIKGGTSVSDGYYMFDYDEVKTIRMGADTHSDCAGADYNEFRDKITDYNLNVKDTITIFLLSIQDVVSGDQNYLTQYKGEHVTDASIVTQNNLQTYLAKEVQDLLGATGVYANGGRLHTSEKYVNATTGDYNTGLRVVSGRKIVIESKRIIIKPSHVFGEGKYEDDQLQKLALIKTLEEKQTSLGKVINADTDEFIKDCKALTDALKAYNDATTEAEKNKWLKERKDKARQELKLLGMTDEEADAFIEERAGNYEDNYDKVVLNTLQLAVDEARIKLGRVEPKQDSAKTYYRNSKIPTLENQKPENADTHRTTIDYDETTGLPRNDTITVLTSTSGNVEHEDGSADRLKDVLGEARELENELARVRADYQGSSNRTLTFSLKLDSETTGPFGTADIQITFGSATAKADHRSTIKIDETKIDGYGFIDNFHPDEKAENYDKVTVTVQYHETGGSDTTVDITGAKEACSLSISDVRYIPGAEESTTAADGKTYKYITYTADNNFVEYVCTDVAVSSSTVYPTVTYVFTKK